MTEDIKTRLQVTSEDCYTAYEAWAGDKKNTKLREVLQEAVHELRKVASRLEIEVAVSDRREGGQKPMPIPSHRDSRGKNNSGNGNSKDARKSSSGGQRRTLNKKSDKSDDAAEG